MRVPIKSLVRNSLLPGFLVSALLTAGLIVFLDASTAPRLDFPLVRRQEVWLAGAAFSLLNAVIFALLTRRAERATTERLAPVVRDAAERSVELGAAAELAHDSIGMEEPFRLKQEAARRAGQDLKAKFCGVFQDVAEGEGLLLTAGVGWPEGEVGRAELATTIPEALRHASAQGLLEISLSDGRAHPWSRSGLLREHGIRRGICAFIPGREQPVGLLGAFVPEERVFTEQEADLLRSIAGLLGMAIEHQQVRARLNVHQAATHLFSEVGSVAEVTPKLLHKICEAVGWEIGEYWSIDVQGEALELESLWVPLSLELEKFHASGQRTSFQKGVGLPGRVWATGTSQWVGDIGKALDHPRARIASDLGLRGSFAVPVVSGPEFLGVMAFYWRDAHPPHPEVLQMLETLGKQFGSFIVRKRAEDAMVQSEERYRSLSGDILEASEVGTLIADSDFQIVWINSALERFFGLRRREALGQDVRMLVRERVLPRLEAPEAFETALLRAYADATRADPYTLHVLGSKDVGERWLQYSSQPIRAGLYAGGRVEHYSDVTERTRVEAELSKRVRQQEAIATLGQKALDEMDLDALMGEAVGLAAANLDVEYIKLLELLPEGKKFLLRAGVGWREEYPIGETTVSADLSSQAGYALFSFGPVIVQDLPTETRFSSPELLHDHGVLSGISVIIPGREKPFGVLGAHTARRRDFSQDDVHFLQAVANLLADAIDRNRAGAELLRAREELEMRIQVRTTELSKLNEALQEEILERERAENAARALLHVSERLNRQLDVEAITDTLVREAVRLADAEGGCVGIATPEGMACKKCLADAGFVGVDYLWKPGHGLAGWLLEHRIPYITNDAGADPQMDEDFRRRFNVRSALSIPLLGSNGEVMGFFEAHNKRGSLFSEFDKDKLMAVAQTASIAIQNALAYERHLEAQEEIRRSEQQLMEAQRIAQIGSWEWDIESNVVAWTPELYRIYGLRPDEFAASYEGFLERVHPDDRERTEAIIAQAYEDQLPFAYEHRVVRPDGVLRVLQASGKVITDDFDRPIRMIGTGQDVTERKRVEEALRMQTELYEGLLSAQSDLGLGVVVAEGEQILYMNEAMVEILGYSKEELEEITSFMDLIAPEEREAVNERLTQRRASAPPTSHHETTVLRKNGQGIQVEYSVNTYAAGDEVRTFAMMRDITRRKRAQETIRAQLSVSQKLNATLEVDELLDALVQEAIRLVEAEAGWAGLRVDDELHCQCYFRGDERVELERRWLSGEGLPGRLLEHKVPYVANDALQDEQISRDVVAELGVRSAISIPILDSEKRVVGFFEIHNKQDASGFTPFDEERLVALAGIASVAIQNALSYRKIQEAEAQLIESGERLRQLTAHLEAAREQERSRIAREIHDELGQALTGLKMDLAWLDSHMRGAATGNAEALLAKSQSMSELVDLTIQTVRRIATDLRPGVLDDLGLEAALEWQAAEFERRAGIVCKVTSRLDGIDPGRETSTAIFRIFQEALTNVARHAHATRVVVTLNWDGERLLLEVDDNGEGISPREIAASESLGLLGMRERARLLGGEVQLTGRAGRGTRLRLVLPYREGSSEPEAAL